MVLSMPPREHGLTRGCFHFSARNNSVKVMSDEDTGCGRRRRSEGFHFFLRFCYSPEKAFSV